LTEDDFYQRPAYAARAADNLAKWLGLQHLAPIDAVILLPLLVPIVALSIARRIFLHVPWGEWLRRKVPRVLLGAYLMCWTLELWHLQADRRIVLTFALAGSGVLFSGLIDVFFHHEKE
jgi:hypothetical protein